MGRSVQFFGSSSPPHGLRVPTFTPEMRVLLLLIFFLADTAAVANNDITSNAAPFFMPPGCSCQKSGAVNDHTCDKFDCNCQCDITADLCDLNCCCDTDCGSHSFVTCLDEGKPPPIVKMCVEGLSALESNNLQYPFRVSDSPEDQLHGLVCIEKDNSAVKGDFFQDQGYPTQVFSPGSRVAKPLTFHTHPVNREISYGTYQLGSKIAAYTLMNDNTISTNAYLGLTSPGDGGTCVDSNAVRFGISESNTCLRKIEDLAVDCETKFNIDRYASVLVEAEKGSAVFGAQDTGPSNGLIPVGIVGHQSATWDESSLICRNALQSLTYNIIYNQTTIVDVSIEAETTDIGIDDGEIKLDFATRFTPVAKEPRRRSGNPGYIKGLPTLGAVISNVNETVSYLNAQMAGLAVMDSGVGGQCSTSSSSGSIVGFANDMLVGCTQTMTRHELKEFCTSDVHPMLYGKKIGDNSFIYPKWLESEQDVVGIFGNADPLDSKQWIKIESSLNEASFTRSRSWIDAESKCVGMPSKLHIEILWTHVGNVKNPQAKILR